MKRGPGQANNIGLTRNEYTGSASTLCKGCGHNSISSQIIQVAYELSLKPEEIIKLSGIGCSSKSPAYFLGMSHGINALHGRMPAVATGALLANASLKAIGVSGDGDTGSIGLGNFKHLVRRNVRMVYVIENNGVYGLTKGQFSSTADEGQELKYAGDNPFPEMDLCLEALIAGCGFVARSFAGDVKQIRALLKAALSHRGTAVLDIISPCVAFNNQDISTKSFGYGRANQSSLHEIGYVPPMEEIILQDHEPGELEIVELHDGSQIQLRKLEAEYDASDRIEAVRRVQLSQEHDEFLTGLLYIDSTRPSLSEVAHLVETPLAELTADQIRPSKNDLDAALKRYM